MDFHDNAKLYCDEMGKLPIVSIVGTLEQDDPKDFRELMQEIIDLVEIASVKYLAVFLQPVMGEDDSDDMEEGRTRIIPRLLFINNTMKFAFLEDFFPEEPPP